MAVARPVRDVAMNARGVTFSSVSLGGLVALAPCVEPPVGGEAVVAVVGVGEPPGAVVPAVLAGAVGVTAPDAEEGRLLATAFVAVTVNVYALPFVRPPIVVVVAGGDPVTVVGVWAAEPIYGVTV